MLKLITAEKEISILQEKMSMRLGRELSKSAIYVSAGRSTRHDITALILLFAPECVTRDR